MASTTLGVKVDDALRDRLKAAAQKLNCTPHWLHKQAILAYLDRIERGHLPAEMSHLGGEEGAEDEAGEGQAIVTPPFYEFGQDVQPQSVLRAAITAAYRRPEPECVPLLLGQARMPNWTRSAPWPPTGEEAARQAHWRRRRGPDPEFSLSSRKAWR